MDPSLDEIKYVMALLLVQKVGHTLAKNLIVYAGSAEAVFREKKQALKKIPGVGEWIAQNIYQFSDFDRVEEELAFIQRHHIKPLYYLSDDYPKRLKDLHDAPALLFFKGNGDLNRSKIIAVVGTRKATDYGKFVTKNIMEGLAPFNPCIVSGLAFGIDHIAHSSAITNNLENIAVLGHGLHTIYPFTHKNIARDITQNGGLLTEYFSGRKPDRENFPERNRIVAGMSDAVILVESGIKGGALITANIAYSYNREVFAFPGRTIDTFSEGCNFLIKTNKAVLIEKASDIAYNLCWDLPDNKRRLKINVETTDEEEQIINFLNGRDKTHFDMIIENINWPASRLSPVLMSLEMKGLIQTSPGNHYRLI